MMHGLRLTAGPKCWNCRIFLRWGHVLCWDCVRAMLISAATVIGAVIAKNFLGL